MTTDATVIEIWLVFALAAAVVVVWNLFDAYSNLNYLDANGENGRRRLLAIQHIRSEGFRLTVCAANVVGAAIVMSTEARAIGPAVIASTVTSFVMLIWSVLDAKTRHTLRIYRAEGGRRATDNQTERFGDPSERQR